ncbi:hypothetical protein D0B97_17755 [Vibrio cholerae]|nr:hypothetical protein [Vibrio cholerae]
MQLLYLSLVVMRCQPLRRALGINSVVYQRQALIIICLNIPVEFDGLLLYRNSRMSIICEIQCQV